MFTNKMKPLVLYFLLVFLFIIAIIFFIFSFFMAFWLQCIWFNGLSWIIEKFKINDQIAVFGKIEFYNGLKITHPDFDILDDNEDSFNTGQIISMYASTSDLKSKGLDSKGFRKIIKNILLNKKYIIEDFLPNKLINEENFWNDLALNML